MNERWTELIQTQRRTGWVDLAGSRFEIVVPIRQALIDRVLGGIRQPGGIGPVRVRLQDGNRFTVSAVATIFGFRKRFDIRLRLAPALDRGTRLIATMENHAVLAGLLAMAAPALPLPDGISMDGARIVIDLGRLAAVHGMKDLMQQLAQASFETRGDALWVNALLEVRQTEGVEPAPLGWGRTASAPAVDLGDVSRLLAGLRAIWTLRISQRLLNTMIQAALDTASTAMSETETGPAATQNAGWPLNLRRVMRTLQVQLEAGTLVVTGDAQLPDDVRGAGL